MIWSFRFAQKKGHLEALEAAQQAGKRVPALENRPNIIGLSWLWAAFWELSTCRAMGALMGPIPWSAIHAYAQAEGLRPQEALMLHAVVRHMDTIWLDHQEEKAHMKAKAKPKQGKPRGASR